MRNLVLCFCVLFCVSCVSRTRLHEAERVLDSLRIENDRNKDEAEQMSYFVNVISEGLDSIAHHESIIYMPDPESKSGKLSRSQILDNIKEFEKLIQRQRMRIKELEDSLANRDNTEKLLSVISHLNAQLEKKENEVLSLKDELSRKNADLSKLRKKVVSLESDVETLNKDLIISQEKDSVNRVILRAQDEYLNQGLYLIGTRKELSGYGIDRNGVMSAEVADNVFTSVDMRTFAQLEIPSERVKVISPMPPSSYVLTKNGNGTSTLEIFDPGEFWMASKYLIIQIR